MPSTARPALSRRPPPSQARSDWTQPNNARAPEVGTSFASFPRMDPIRVTSWTQLLDLLYADSWKEELGRFRSDCAFRGLEAPEDELLTGLMRLGGDYAHLE